MNTIVNIFIREIERLRSRSSAWVLILIIPTIIFIYLGGIYKKGGIEKVQIAILDQDQTPFSKTILTNLSASPKIEVIKKLSADDKLESIFQKYPDIKGVYYIPNNFSKDISQGRQVVFTVYTNSANIIYGNLLYKEAATFINTISAKITLTRLSLKGIPFDKARQMLLPVKIEARPLFNPYYNYLYYLIPGLTTVLLQMIVFFLGTRSINSEFKDGTFNDLYDLSGRSVAKIIAGKLLCYSTIGLLITLFILTVIYPFLGIPLSANALAFLPVFLVFILANVMLGMALSVVFNNQAIAMDMAFVYNSPAFVFSGFTFPIMAMPAFNSWYANLIPYTHFLQAFTKGFEMENSILTTAPQIINLLIFVLLAYVICSTLLMYKTQKLRQ